MKVFVCIPCLLTGGTEIQTLSLVEALVCAGHQVVTVCYFEYDKAIVVRYEAVGSKVILLSDEGRRPAGVKNTVFFLYQGLRRVVKEEKPDIAHVQYMAPGAIPVLLLRMLGVGKIVATAHTDADIYSKKGLRLVRFIAKYGTVAFQCITLKAEKSYFGSASLFDGTLKKHFTIYNALPSYITVTDKAKQFASPVTVGVVSRLESIKGMDMVVPAFARIHAAFPDVRLLVVGDGSLRPLLEEQVRRTALVRVVEFAGRQPQHLLQTYYDRIDILLMPSRSEGFGLTALEGMARGCAVVAARTGGLPEVVGEAGLLHTPGDADDLAAQIESLLSGRERLLACSKAGREQASRFSAEAYSRQIADLYAQLTPSL